MADLIAQGPELQHRWRRTLPMDKPIVLGRQSQPGRCRGTIAFHASTWKWLGTATGSKVQALSDASQSSLRARATSKRHSSFSPGEHFVIGNTTFSLADDHINVSLEIPQPMQEQAFSAQYLQRMRFRNADQRIENLSRLPEIISSAGNDTELFVRLVNVLLVRRDNGAMRRRSCDVSPAEDRGVQILHWDQRRMATTPFQPSERLILEAVRRGESVLHVWNVPRRRAEIHRSRGL